MQVIAINGSPRKNWNTAMLLEKALAGAVSQGAEGELINLYDLNFKGCISCFACKLKGGSSYGKCAYQDDLSPVLAKIAQADVLLLGSPIYFGNVTGEMRSFMERVLFPYLVYDEHYSSLAEKKKKIGFIYTMNVTAEQAEAREYPKTLAAAEGYFARMFGEAEALPVHDTYQFAYDRYVSSAWNAEQKAQRREDVFPQDCQKAFALGVRLSSAAQ